jgi:hypothetical protein
MLRTEVEGSPMVTLNRQLKVVLRRILPSGLFQRLVAIRSRRYQLKVLENDGTLKRVKSHIEEHGTIVLSGPFKGMIYPLESATIRLSLPKLLGTYEDEVHPFLEEMRKRKYDCIIDVGSAEGYYAVGLARAFQIPVYAYDPEPLEKNFSAQMALRNNVHHLVVMGNLFTADDMQTYADKRVLMVCDCEGFEEVLFRSETLSFTQNWDLLIELHGTAEDVLPNLPWPHATTLVKTRDKIGDQDEKRSNPQCFLLCDSHGTPPRTA